MSSTIVQPMSATMAATSRAVWPAAIWSTPRMPLERGHEYLAHAVDDRHDVVPLAGGHKQQHDAKTRRP